ncbi:MAG: glycoside hydrolase family 130 protein [Verrucomicrobiota bacterium]
MSIIARFPENPLFTPADLVPSHPGMEVMCVFNPAATWFQGKRLLLLRVAEKAVARPGWVATPILDPASGDLRIEQFRRDDPDLGMSDPRAFTYRGEVYLTSLSHLRAAVSADGVHFQIDPKPTLFPEGRYEAFGVEDARITRLDDAYYVNYTAVSSCGVGTALVRTTDFRSFERLGLAFGPDNKDVALFPERIGGRYHAFHRPSTRNAGLPSIWIASSDNLLDWGRHEIVIRPRLGGWDSDRVGAGTAPIRTPEGWLALYHGCDHASRYCLGALLLDLDKPWQVIRRSEKPFFTPEAPYEQEGFLPHVVFHNGTLDLGDGRLELYYGGADQVTCGARVRIADLLAHLGA